MQKIMELGTTPFTVNESQAPLWPPYHEF